MRRTAMGSRGLGESKRLAWAEVHIEDRRDPRERCSSTIPFIKCCQLSVQKVVKANTWMYICTFDSALIGPGGGGVLI